MSPQSKKEYAQTVRLRYKNAARHEKTVILDEFCATCGYHRKHAVRVLTAPKHLKKLKTKKRGKPPTYQNETICKPLKKIWLKANLPCSKRLEAILPLWLPGYVQLFDKLSMDVISALLKISPSTIDRLLKPIRANYTKRGRSSTKPGTLSRKQIPIKTSQWDESRPGFLEADTVAHCGDSLSGMFVYTVNFVDIATGWTEQRAVWGKGETGVLEQIKHIEKGLPFSILGFDCDNGGEFLNYHLLRHFTKRKQPVQFTRSRAYHKDDNAHIEQKNWTHVRQWLGYDRLNNPSIIPLLNNLYTKEWRIFHNFFCPSVKLTSKERIASKTIRHYDSPKTPYQRIMDSPHILDSVKSYLSKQLENHNPFLLRENMDKKLRNIFSVNNKLE